MARYTTEIGTSFQDFERKHFATLHIFNDSNSSGDELHLESTPDNGDSVDTVDEYTNADMQSDGTLVDRIEPLPRKLRIEEVTGSWTVYVGEVNHPDVQFN